MTDEDAREQDVPNRRIPAVYLPATPSPDSDRLDSIARRLTRRRGAIGWDRRADRN